MWWEDWLMAKPPGSLGKQLGLLYRPGSPPRPVEGALRPRESQDIWLMATASLPTCLRRKRGLWGKKVLLWFREARGAGSWPEVFRTGTLPCKPRIWILFSVPSLELNTG